MRMTTRIVLLIIGVLALGTAAGFLLNVRAVVGVWPYATDYGLSKVFIASMFAAIGAPIVWIALAGDLAAVRSGAANILFVAIGLAVHAGWRFAQSGQPRHGWFSAGNAALAVISIVMIALARRVPWRDTRVSPLPVRIAFGVFALWLVVAGASLVAQLQIFPWTLDADASVVYGLMFLGASVYFLYGVLVPVWSNAKGQLIGFLAYDLVLLVPYVRLWPTAGAQQLGLTIYIVVLVASGIISIIYLLLLPRWRLFAPRVDAN